MKTILKLLFLTIFIISCESNSLGKEKQVHEKVSKKQTAQTIDSIIPNPSVTSPPEVKEEIQQVSWHGKWVFEHELVSYTLTIEDKKENMNLCKFEAIGVQTFYDLECRGVDKGNSFELYFHATNDGAFLQEERINRHKPILTLKQVDGKILTDWNQLIGGTSGKVAFKKQ